MAEDPPLLTDYFDSARTLAATLREALDKPNSIPRSELRQQLEHFEQLDHAASDPPDCTHPQQHASQHHPHPTTKRLVCLTCHPPMPEIKGTP